MKSTLNLGIHYQHKLIVPLSKTVSALYPELAEAFGHAGNFCYLIPRGFARMGMHQDDQLPH
ncbi:MAG: hypothetical protein ABIT70_07095 [Sulfuriferula sp.]